MDEHIGRRTLLCGAMAAAGCGLATGTARLVGQDAAKGPDPNCRRCRGLSLVPKSTANPYVFVEGQGVFRPADAAIGQPCPVCHGGAEAAQVVAQSIDATEREHADVLAQHAQWEERLGEKFLL